MTKNLKEKDLFQPIKDFFIAQESSREIYGELLGHDLVAIQGTMVLVVEMKLRLNFKVIDQAIEAKGIGHYVYIAIPKRRTRIPLSVKKLLKSEKIGLLTVSPNQSIEVELAARFNRLPNQRIKNGFRIQDHIEAFHKHEVGGVPSGEGKTRYSQTIDQIKSYLRYYRRKEWAPIDDLLKHCETHYANPKPSVVATLQKEWNTSWCETKVEDGARYFKYKSS